MSKLPLIIIHYILAVVLIIATLWVRLWVGPIPNRPLMILFVIPIIFSATLGGLGPGLFATALAALLTAYFIVPPIHTFAFANPLDLMQWSVMVITGILVSLLTCTLRRSARQAAEARLRARELEREQASQAALRQSEERLRLAINATHALVYDNDLISRRSIAIEGLKELLGYRSGEVDPTPEWWFAQVHPEDGFTPEMAQALMSRNDAFSVEYRMRHKDGHYLNVVDSGRVLRDSNGCPARIVGCVMDVTARKEAERELREREERLRLHIENSPLAAVEWDRDFRVVNWSEGAERLFGWSEHEVLGKHPAEFGLIHEDDREGVESMIAKLNMGAAPRLTNANRNRRKDGRVAYCEWQNSALLDERGETISIMSLAQDVTARVEAEAALRSTTALLQTLSETTEDPVFVKDRDGRMLLANPATLRAIGKPAEVVLGKKETEWLNDSQQAHEIMVNDQRIMESGQTEVVEEWLTGPDGLRVYLGTKSPLRDESGRVVGLVGISRDITERKQAEEALRAANEALAEADRRKDEFLAMLAHELRNPLAPVRNAIQIMQTFCAGSCNNAERMTRQRQIIDRQVTHMARLLDDLLDVSRVTRGKITLKMQPVALSELLPHVADIVQPQLESRSHELIVTPAPEGLRVEADWDRLIQIVGNLLTNAAKYTDLGGRIWLEAGREGEQAVIRVRDSGMGIAPEMLSRVFELFAQAEGGLARSQGGLGIGLTMAHRLVQMHGGAIEAWSEGLGQGSEFTIRLPALPESAGPAALRTRTQSRPRVDSSRRVLVVDDMADSAASLAELLSLWGHEVRTVYDGRAALDAAREFKPEIVLLDIGLPGMDGYEVARRLREEWDGIRPWLVALTGYGAEEDRRRALEAGFDQHLVKPVDLARLRELLAQEHAPGGSEARR